MKTPLLRQCLVHACLPLAAASALMAADPAFREGDEIKLLHPQPMYFRADKFRDAAAGEQHRVLAYRSDEHKVFVQAKDADGKDIALSVSDDAVELLKADPIKALAAAKAALDSRKFAEARTAISVAKRTNQQDEKLTKALASVEEAEAAHNALEAAKVGVAKAAAEAAPMRRYASMSLYNKIKNETLAKADKLQRDALDAQKRAEAKLNAASAFAAAGGGKRPKGNGTASPQVPEPTTAEIASFRASWDEDANHPANPADVAFEDIKTGATTDGEQNYETTLEFINRKLRDNEHLYFSKNHRKLILRRGDKVTIFAAEKMNPGVKYETISLSGSSFMAAHKEYRCIIEPTNKKEKGTMSVQSPVGQPHPITSFYIYVSDQVELEKMAKAWRRLIQLCGGKDEAF